MSLIQVQTERIIYAPVQKIWEIITDLTLLSKINPNVVSVTGAGDQPGDERIVELRRSSGSGTVTEKLVEKQFGSHVIWLQTGDTMNMSSLIRDARFVTRMEPTGPATVRVIMEAYYIPVSSSARMLNDTHMKPNISKAHELILQNIKEMAEASA
jgi:hypothetical protein